MSRRDARGCARGGSGAAGDLTGGARDGCEPASNPLSTGGAGYGRAAIPGTLAQRHQQKSRADAARVLRPHRRHRRMGIPIRSRDDGDIRRGRRSARSRLLQRCRRQHRGRRGERVPVSAWTRRPGHCAPPSFDGYDAWSRDLARPARSSTSRWQVGGSILRDTEFRRLRARRCLRCMESSSCSTAIPRQARTVDDNLASCWRNGWRNRKGNGSEGMEGNEWNGSNHLVAVCAGSRTNGDIHWYNRRWIRTSTGTTLRRGARLGLAQRAPSRSIVERAVEKLLRSCFATGEPWEPTRSAAGARQQLPLVPLSRAILIRDADMRACVLRWFGTNTDVTGALPRREARAARRRIAAGRVPRDAHARAGAIR